MGFWKDYQIEVDERGWEDLDRFACSACLADAALKEFVDSKGLQGTCSFCGSIGLVVRGNDLMERIAAGVFLEWGSADDIGIPYDGAEGGYQGYITDLHHIFEWIGWPFANEDLAAAVIEAFVDIPWVSRYEYDSSPEEALRWGWSAFVEYTSHNSRFFFLTAPTAKATESWEEIPPAEMLDHLGDVIVSVGLIEVMPEGTRFVRVRAHDAATTYSTKQDLGPPPVDVARSSNRMSPVGIPMFYGSMDKATAMAETRAARSEPTAAATSAEFVALRPLALVNLVDIPEIPSAFDPNWRHLRGPVAFLHDFARAIAGPVSIDEEEHLEYVPTQIVTEYVRHILPDKVGRDIHGIRYRSSRADGVNVVLFVNQDGCTTLNLDEISDQDLVLAMDLSTIDRLEFE